MRIEPKLHRESKFVGTGFLLVVFAMFATSILFTRVVVAEKQARSCADTRAQGLNPQLLLDSDPIKYARFDRDHDGIACE